MNNCQAVQAWSLALLPAVFHSTALAQDLDATARPTGCHCWLDATRTTNSGCSCLRRLQLTKGIGRKQAAAHRAKQKKDDHLDEGEEDAEPIVEHQFDPTGGLGKQRQGLGFMV